VYIRRTVKRTHSGKEYVNYLLVESVATPKGPRQKIVCSLGNLRPRPRAEWEALVRRVQDALGGQAAFEGPDPEARRIAERIRERRGASAEETTEELISVRAELVTTEEIRVAGPLHVGRHFYSRLGIAEVLAECGLSERSRQLTEVMVLGRLVHPDSELATAGWAPRTALADWLAVRRLHESSLYRQLDRLHPQREKIERFLAERERCLFSLENTIYLYDLTSTYFEGQMRANPAAQRGYSRDSRPDCKQVLIGLVLDPEGFPKAHEVFPGNRSDGTTVEEMLQALEDRVGGRQGGLVVVDRGMAGQGNLQAIRDAGHDYLVAGRPAERDQWLDQFESELGWTEVVRENSPRNPLQKKTVVRVKRFEDADHTYALCHSQARVEKDRAIREKQEGRLLTDLNKLEKRIAGGRLKRTAKIHQALGRLKERYPRVARYYRMEWEESSRTLSWKENAEKKEKARGLDGCYLLKSSRKGWTDEQIWRTYVLLTRVENAFRCMKSPLCERPIFHQLERRTETHIFLCVLAYHLLVAIEKTLLDRKVHTSWDTVRETLATHCISTVVLPTSNGDVLRIRKGSTPEPEVRELYDLLGVPHVLIDPVKTWTRKKDSDGKSKPT
jgi:transposase